MCRLQNSKKLASDDIDPLGSLIASGFRYLEDDCMKANSGYYLDLFSGREEGLLYFWDLDCKCSCLHNL